VFGFAGITSAFLCFLLPETNNLALSDALEGRSSNSGCTTNHDDSPSDKLEHVSTKTTLVAIDELH
jgi:hypothetical protein